MPDPVTFLKALALSAETAAVVLLLLGGLGRLRLGWVLGVGSGFFVGCWFLDVRPRWPPREDLHRFLALLLPAVVAVECVAALPKVPRGLPWALRLLVAAGAAPVLLYNTTYLADLSGPSTREWSPVQAAATLAGLALTLLTVWLLLALLAKREAGPALPLCLALAAGSAGVAVMLSGHYLTGGQVGLPLAGALAGAAAVSFALPAPRAGPSAIGVGVVGLFGLVVIGRFLGDLGTLPALLLFCAPLLGWLPEVPRVRELRPWLRGSLRIGLIAIALALIVIDARRLPPAEADETKSTPAPTRDDYLRFIPQEPGDGKE